MLLPDSIRPAPKNLTPPLNNRQRPASPDSRPDIIDFILFVIFLIPVSIVLYNIFIYLLARRQRQRRHRDRDREADFESVDEQEDIEHSRAKVRAWIAVNDIAAKPPSPIQIERPRLQCLVPTGLETDVGARAQRPKARRAESAPLLRGGEVESELHFLYDTFETLGGEGGVEAEAEAEGRGRCGVRGEGGDGGVGGMSLALADVQESGGGGGAVAVAVAVAKKRVSFAAGDEVVEASWSTVETVSEGEE